MNTYYNTIFLGIFFISLLLGKMYCGNTSKLQKLCTKYLYKSFGFPVGKRYRNRMKIPILAFKYKRFEMLFKAELPKAIKKRLHGNPETTFAQDYFMQIHKDLCAKNGTLNVREWCYDPDATKFENDLCVERLLKFFVDLNATQTIRHAYLFLVVDKFNGINDYAFQYFDYLAGRMDTATKFMSPSEMCATLLVNIAGTSRRKHYETESDSETESEYSPSPSLVSSSSIDSLD